MMSQRDAAILQVRFDDSVHVILLCGAGDEFFPPVLRLAC
jgi:hypothetical protein